MENTLVKLKFITVPLILFCICSVSAGYSPTIGVKSDKSLEDNLKAPTKLKTHNVGVSFDYKNGIGPNYAYRFSRSYKMTLELLYWNYENLFVPAEIADFVHIWISGEDRYTIAINSDFIINEYLSCGTGIELSIRDFTISAHPINRFGEFEGIEFEPYNFAVPLFIGLNSPSLYGFSLSPVLGTRIIINDALKKSTRFDVMGKMLISYKI
ncbi:MAG: hypothetical protein HRT72_07305 [Flavobacteriales bacterium]|nr:hypothetical protein [Flavobacteriales bacterium]